MLYLNGQPVPVTIFPDHTSQVWKLPESVFQTKNPAILWDYRDESEVMHLFQLLHILQTHKIESILTIKYLPYARQDKVVSNDSTFALNTFLLLIRNFSFYLKKIIVHDPHNPDAFRPGCACEFVYPTAEVAKITRDECIGIVCYPDKGAVSKYSKIYDYNYIYGEKVRDQTTGNITSYQLVGDPKGKNVLIIDDICDGGMTFKILAKDLLAAGARSVVLFVSHGIFSKGVRTLFDSGISKVFTQDGEVSERHGSIQF